MKSRIALGSVQFGVSYGVANDQGKVGAQEVAGIISEARKLGIDTIDTAINYGDSEVVLGRVGIKDFKVVSKISDFPAGNFEVGEWVRSQILASIERLGVERLHAVLFHKQDQLFGAHGAAFYEAVHQLKSDGLIEKIGISIYAPTELKAVIENFSVDLVQAPLNLIDQRLIESGWISTLGKRGIELHSRSVFLQGLLLMKPDERPDMFGRWQALWDEWDKWLLDVGLTPLQACIRHALSIPGIERVIVGVNSMSQLQEIASASCGAAPELPNWTTNIDQELVNPSLWKNL